MVTLTDTDTDVKGFQTHFISLSLCQCEHILMAYSHCRIQTLLDSDSCTMQKFHIGSDSDSDPLTEMYVVGTEIHP